MFQDKSLRVTSIVSLVLLVSCRLYAIDLTASSGGGPSPQSLAENVADTLGGVAVVASSATTAISNPGQGNPASDARSQGTFINGNTASGTPLPAGNGGPTETYVAGIDIDAGVCLCTGVVSDSLATAGPNLGFGLEGPNNGDGEGIIAGTIPGSLENHTGEFTTTLFGFAFQDDDFVQEVFPGNNPGGGDASVLKFNIETTAPGFIRLSFVFGSDEFPAYVDPDIFQFNDSFAAIIAGENIATLTANSVVSPFSLYEISECSQLFIKNDTAPQPTILTQAYVDPVDGPLPNVHAVPAASNYNIELGGFTRKLTRETCCVLAPGTYEVKIVIQDVVDQRVDAAVFLESNGLKLFDFLPADFDLDGDIDGNDFSILSSNFGDPGTFKFVDGDANGDGAVDGLDFSILSTHFGQTGGNKNFCADFDRDGDVDAQDHAVYQQYVGLLDCASRFEGDADRDGDVDANDLTIYQQESTTGVPSGLCDCGASQQQSLTGGGGTTAAQGQSLASAPAGHPHDTDGDGDFDRIDLDNWAKILGVE